MKWSIRSWLLCAAAILAAAAAVLLPPQLSGLADSRLDLVQYAVQAENLDVSLISQMSMAERLDLFSRSTGDGVFRLTDIPPAQDELSLEQAFLLCQDELDALYQMGALPSPFLVQSLTDSAYCVLYDRENPQRSLSLWMLDLSAGDGGVYSSADLVMDAQSGLIYALHIPYLDIEGVPVSSDKILTGWGEYLSLGEPLTEDEPFVFPQFLEDLNSGYVQITLSSYVTQAEYQTDEGFSVVYFLELSARGNAYGKLGTWISLFLSPFSLE